MQSIYPLILFILVALDKIHHSRGLQALRSTDHPKQRGPSEAVTVTFEVDIERSTIPAPNSAHQRAEVWHREDRDEGEAVAEQREKYSEGSL